LVSISLSGSRLLQKRLKVVADMTVDETEQERAAILGELDPASVIEELPPTVFPVTAKVALKRSYTGDSPHGTYRTPEFPVDVRVPTETPYIPEQTVYFDNPAERPPDGVSAWRPSEFIDSIGELEVFFDEETRATTDRLYLTGLCIVEIPSLYLTHDDGQQAAEPGLYDENGEMTLAYFKKDSSLTAHKVREHLGDALPGETRTPLQLTRLDEVHAKPARTGRGTVGDSGRRRYFSEREAAKSNNEEMIPGVWKADRVASASESYRPLDAVVTQLDEFLPALSDSELLESVTFQGTVEESERFFAETIL
jgi:hypothetical protein